MLRRGGLPGRPRQLQPGHDHDRPRSRRPDLRRAARPRRARGHHRAGAARRPAADAGRPDRAQPGHGAARAGRARRFGVELIGATAGGHPHGRGPRALQGGDGARSASRCRRRGSPTRSTRPWRSASEIGFPIMVRPELHPGRRGHRHRPRPPSQLGTARPAEGLAASPIGEILVERSIAGWKEYELEVMRDRADNCVVVCSIENLDPMGVHTGDSITVAPAQTLSDVEYQAMRDDAFACIRRVGVETGGSNIQFAVDPADGRPARHRDEPPGLAVVGAGLQGHRVPHRQDRRPPGRRLPPRRDRQRHHRATPASFEPTIDYVVTKIPRWAFEKLPGRRRPARHPDAVGRRGHGHRPDLPRVAAEGAPLARAGPGRAERRPGRGRRSTPSTTTSVLGRAAVADAGPALPARGGPAAGRRRRPAVAVADRTGIDPLVPRPDRPDQRGRRRGRSRPLRPAGLRAMDRARLPPGEAARLLRRPARLPARGRHGPGGGAAVRAARLAAGSRHLQDRRHLRGRVRGRAPRTTTRTYEDEDEVRPRSATRVIILGSGPNRIGQGIEFDYCCVHASMALRDAGYETVMVNCNPETVSTDYDTSDRLYFEPLTAEDVANVHRRRGARAGGRRGRGRSSRLGGQTPLKLAGAAAAGPGARAPARPRSTWPRTASGGTPCASALGIPQPPGGTAATVGRGPGRRAPGRLPGARAAELRARRPGHGDRLRRRRTVRAGAWPRWPGSAASAREGGVSAERPVLVDRFLEDAVEVDVDAVRDATGEVADRGVMEHVEEAGVHSGDSACALPPQTLPADVLDVLERHTRAIAEALDGRWAAQRAVRGEGPGRSSCSRPTRGPAGPCPFVAKATGVPLADGRGPGDGRRDPGRAARRGAAAGRRGRPHRASAT